MPQKLRYLHNLKPPRCEGKNGFVIGLHGQRSWTAVPRFIILAV